MGDLPGDQLERIRALARAGDLRVTQHAHQEMVEEDISLDQLLEALATGSVLEDYPEHRRGACCLLGGYAGEGRPLHVVCTTVSPVLIIITVYEPKPSKWVAADRRGGD